MKAGYIHIDTGSFYHNEELIGEVLEDCLKQGKKREELHIATKFWHTEYDDVEAALKRSMKKLKLDYVDLYYMHWPAGFFTESKKPVHVLWAEMESFVDKGLVKSLGVSNFNGQLLRDLLCYAKHKPVVNQIELNPQNAQVALIDFHLHEEVNVRPVAYCPIARPGASNLGDKLTGKEWPDLRENPFLQELAAKYKKSVVQIMLNWGICRGHMVIPKGDCLEHITENIDIFDFKLTDEEVKKVCDLNQNKRLPHKFFWV